MTAPRPPTAAEIRAALSPAAEGNTSFRVEMREESGAPVAVIGVFGAYDCKGTEAEVTGLLKNFTVKWRLVWN
jgi:hypothetical protein